MAADDREGHPRKGRLRRLYDRLAEILRGLPPDRREAFGEHLDEQVKKEEKDDGGSTEEGDRGKR